MNRLSNRQGSGAAFTAEDDMWAGMESGNRSLAPASNMPTGRRILAIGCVYGALLCIGVITLVL